MPTVDEMKELADAIANALRKDKNFNHLEVMDFEPGGDIPIIFEANNENFVLELNVL
jgi:hypothetical protein